MKKAKFAGVAVMVLLMAWSAGGAEMPQATSPLIGVYATGHLPVENVSVAITNPRADVAMLVTSLEFIGQLPELRYFYHGVFGQIRKRGENYEHATMTQTLSLPVGTCLLLPRQSASWKRPMRVSGNEYHARVTWREIPADRLGTCVWFRSAVRDFVVDVYEPLSRSRESRYANIAAGTGDLPRVIVEGEFATLSAEINVPGVRRREVPTGSSQDVPEGGVVFSLESVAESVVVTNDKVVFRKYDVTQRRYEPAPSPDISPAAMDLIFLCARAEAKAIPCVLNPEVFGDLVEVKRPFTEMYYNPGITPVPLTTLAAILNRARERHLSVELRRIDPNSLGREHVLVIGVQMADSTVEQDPKG
jgi:hypothetical protein